MSYDSKIDTEIRKLRCSGLPVVALGAMALGGASARAVTKISVKEDAGAFAAFVALPAFASASLVSSFG
jgi:hypothetical protein